MGGGSGLVKESSLKSSRPYAREPHPGFFVVTSCDASRIDAKPGGGGTISNRLLSCQRATANPRFL